MRLFINSIKSLFKILGLPFVFLLLGLGFNNTTWVPYALFSILISFSFFKNKNINKTILLLILFSFSYFFAMVLNGDSMLTSVGFLVCLILAPSSSYFFGYNSVKKLNYNKDLVILLMLLLISFFTIIIYAKTISSIAITGNIVNISRIIVSDTEQVSKTATLYGLVSAIGLAGLPVCFFCRDFRYKWYNVIYVVIGLLSLLVAIHLVNRTGLAILLLATIIVIVLKSDCNIFKLLLYTTLTIIVLYVIVDYINIEIIDAYVSRNEESDISGGGGRFWRWSDALLKMWRYPLGWINNRYTYNDYCHNMWLDFARQAGLIPFTSFTALTIKSVVTLYRILKMEKSAFTFLLVSLNLCLFLACSMEPVMEGCAFVLFFYCIILGIQDSYYNRLKRFCSNI